MLCGFSDEDSESGDDLPVLDGIPGSWHPASNRRSVAAAYNSLPQNVIGLDLDAAVSAQDGFQVLENPPQCPVERLLRLSVLLNNPQQYVPPEPRKRRRGKHAPPLGGLLETVLRHPCRDPAPHYTWVQRRLGQHEFDRQFSVDINKPIRTARPRARVLWGRASRVTQNRWAVFAQVRRKMYVREEGTRTRRLSAPPDIPDESKPDQLVDGSTALQCIGFLSTWMISLGLDDPTVVTLVNEGVRGDALVEALQQMPMYQRAFDDFKAWFQNMARNSGFGGHAACMELCLNGSAPHRVHLHGFVGPGWDSLGSQTFSRQVNLYPTEWLWQGVKPDMRIMRCSKRSRSAMLEQAGGFYYVLAKKPGSMFRAADRWPFLDISSIFNYQEWHSRFFQR